MSESWSSRHSWILTGLVVPVVVVLLSPIVQPTITALMHRGKELSYEIAQPEIDVSQDLTNGLPITIGGIQMNSFVVYKVLLKNSGGEPLSDLPVKIEFTPTDDPTNFQIVVPSHHTNPAKEFGKITEESEQFSKRFTYKLLNVGDSDSITFLVTKRANVTVYSKAEGMTLVEGKSGKGISISNIAAVTGIAIVALQTFVFDILRKRRDIVNRELKAKALSGSGR